jgi:hypothetical protein
LPLVRAITWIKERGAEFAELELGLGELRAAGVAVSGDPVPYRLEYELDCQDGFATRRLSVRAWGAGWGRHLELTRDPRDGWAVDAGSDGDPGVPGAPPAGGDPAALPMPSTVTSVSARSRTRCRCCAVACSAAAIRPSS